MKKKDKLGKSELFSDTIVKRNIFNYRVQRMLWAYGFENLFKGILIIDKKRDNSSLKQVPLDEIKSHDLIDLANKANIKLTNDGKFYLGILTKCSIWAGRYPLPINSDQMYQTRASMKSHQDLFDRYEKMWQKYIKGEIPRMESERDVMFSSMSQKEYNYYSDLNEEEVCLFNKFN